MFYLQGLKSNLSNLAVLGKTVQPDAELKSLVQLKATYNRFLSKFQPQFTLTQQAVPETVTDCGQIQNLIALFGQKTALNDLKQDSAILARTEPEESIQVHNSVEEAAHARLLQGLEMVSRTDEGLGLLVKTAMNLFFFAPSNRAGGGSSSGAIGCVWVNPRPSWTNQDYCEFLVHELTHQLLFLDELRFGHYTDYALLERPENFAHSTILNRQRPLDKVVHSLIVAFEVLRFRKIHFAGQQKTFLHPKTEDIQSSLKITLNSLRQMPQTLLNARAWSLIEKVEADAQLHFPV